VKILNQKLILILILGVSAFAHLWNPVGFPEIFYDEGIYMQRSMNIINGVGPQEGKFYDHPFFGQIFLGSILYLIGYPDSANPTFDSAENLYLIPRIVMGLLAVFDTFLIYKIAQKRYDSKIAIFASLLFAVMPIGWITRRILLDSILLPFVLLSILFVLQSQNSERKTLLVFFSGVFLGLAILTKIPAFTMIPVVTYLTYSMHKNKKLLLFVLIPALLIPMIWPVYSMAVSQFEYWQQGVLWQAQRQNTGIHNTVLSFGAIDPVLFGLGIAGLIYCGVKKNWFVLFWAIPFIVFLSLIGYTQYFHWMILLPVFCISASILIANLGQNLKQKRLIPIFVILATVLFGLTSNIMLLSLDVTHNQFESAKFAAKLGKENMIPVLAGPQFMWIYNGVFGQDMLDYSEVLFKQSPERFVLIADPHFYLDYYRGQELSQLYNSTKTIAVFPSVKSDYDVYQYPYSSLGYNYDAGTIEIKIFDDLSN